MPRPQLAYPSGATDPQRSSGYRNLAAQQSPAVPSVLSFRRSTGAVGSEAPRLHHGARRRGRVAVLAARAQQPAMRRIGVLMNLSQMRSDINFTPREDKTIDFSDQDQTYKAVLHRCPD